MGADKATRLSKRLSAILRHRAADKGLQVRADGFVELAALLALPDLRGVRPEDVAHVVATSDKKRFELRTEIPSGSGEDKKEEGRHGTLWVRAVQGHSGATGAALADEALLTPLTEPLPLCVHGTTARAWQAIQRDGLRPMKRVHIHLAAGFPGNVVSGGRASSDVWLRVDMAAAMRAGIAFFRAANGVILTRGNNESRLPATFLSKVIPA